MAKPRMFRQFVTAISIRATDRQAGRGKGDVINHSKNVCVCVCECRQCYCQSCLSRLCHPELTLAETAELFQKAI